MALKKSEYDEPNYDELLQALAQDVEGSFPCLVNSCHSQLLGYVVSHVKDPSLAEEILQESWIRVYQALQRYSEERICSLKLRAWLFTVVRNEMLTHLGKKKGDTVPIEDLADIVTDEATLSLEEIFELRDRVEEVKEAVAQLPPKLREVLKLFLFDGLNRQEIAQQLNIPVGNVSTHISRGLNKLREKLTAISTKEINHAAP